MEVNNYGKYFPGTLKAYYEETKEGIRSHLLTHSLLQHLDIFKPLLIIPLQKLLDHEEELLRRVPLKMTLEFWSIPSSSFRDYFPESFLPSSLLQPVINLLGFVIPTQSTVPTTANVHVCILDVITTLCLLLYGDWKLKMEILFRWYNLNNTGLMEEDEHFLLLKRIGHCLRKLKLIGVLDLTDDDAKFMAIQARIVLHTDKDKPVQRLTTPTTVEGEGERVASFRPGLYVDEFITWSETNTVCSIAFKFMKVLQRLVDVMAMLDMRTEKLHQITLDKQREAEKSYPIPIDLPVLLQEKERYEDRKTWKKATEQSKEKIINNQTAISDIAVVYCDAHQVSFCIGYDTRLFEVDHYRAKLCPKYYARVDREIHYPDTYQQFIGKNIINRNKQLNDAMYIPGLRNVHKYYTVSSVRDTCVSPKRTSVKPELAAPIAKRVDVRGLEGDTQYRITIFNEHGETYRTVRIKTPPIGVNTKKSSPFTILPATVDVRQYMELRTNGLVDKSHNLLFTGTIGRYDAVSGIYVYIYVLLY